MLCCSVFACIRRHIPLKVKPHLKKCFDNIKTLKMYKQREKWEASHMYSAEGEEVEFSEMLHAEGPVEVQYILIDSFQCI